MFRMKQNINLVISCWQPALQIISIAFISAALLFQISCQNGFEAAKELSASPSSTNTDSDKQGQADGSPSNDDPVPVVEDPAVKDPAIENPEDPADGVADDPNKQAPLWTLNSPSNGVKSSDTTPHLKGVGHGPYANGSAQFYTDERCSTKVGDGVFSPDGSITVDNIQFDANGNDDGRIHFFAKLQDAGGTLSSCMDLGLNYMLDTNIAKSESRRYRLTWREDPSTTMVVGFDARSSSLTEHKIYYDTEDHGRDVESYSFVKSIDVNRRFLDMNNAFARLTDLKPNTVYYFVVKDDKGVSPRYSFKTAPADPSTRLSIVAGGDSRNNLEPRKKGNELVRKLRPHFVFFGGDMTDRGTESQWKEWFDHWQLTVGKDGRMIPIVAARGNHERSNEIIETLFDTSKGVYYALNFGGNLLRAYTLNSESGIGGNQASWLEDDLSKSGAIVWKMAQYHRPIRPHLSTKPERDNQYRSWAGAFFKYKMNLVVESDAHVVKSTWPLRPSSGGGSDEGFIRDDENGTTYIGEGCWGAPLRRDNDKKEWTRNSGVFNHFYWIFVDQSQIEIRTVKIDNAPEVGELSDDDLFSMPSNIDIWKPSNGSVITIKRK